MSPNDAALALTFVTAAAGLLDVLRTWGPRAIALVVRARPLVQVHRAPPAIPARALELDRRMPALFDRIEQALLEGPEPLEVWVNKRDLLELRCWARAHGFPLYDEREPRHAAIDGVRLIGTDDVPPGEFLKFGQRQLS